MSFNLSHGTGILDRSKLEAAYITFSTLFNMAFENAGTIFNEIATVLPNIGSRVEFKWLGDIPVMKKWLGDRQFNKLRAESVALVPEWYANGLEMSRDDFLDDGQLPLIGNRLSSLGEAAAWRMDQLVIDMYLAGFAGTLGLTYDGQFLFDTDHTAETGGATSQSNLQAGAFSSTTWNQALEKMWAFKSANGEPLSLKPTHVLAGISNQLALRTVFAQESKANGEQNIDFGAAEPIISARIPGTHWFALRKDARIRNVILGIQVGAEFVACDNPDSPEVFLRNRFLYGGQAKFGACYGFWQVGVGSTG